MKEEKVWEHHYVLIDPRVEDPIKQVFYVGRAAGTGSTALIRYRQHLTQAGRGHTNYKCNKIRQIQAAGHRVEMLLLPDCEMHEDCETELILAYSANGAKLTNQTLGGEGMQGRSPGELTRSKIAERRKEAWADPAVRERQAATRALPEVQEKYSSAQYKSWEDPETRERRVAGMKAAWNSEEAKVWRGAQTRAMFERPGMKEKHSAAIKQAYRTPEQREKRRINSRKIWESEEKRHVQSVKIRERKAANRGLSVDELSALESKVVSFYSQGVPYLRIAETLGITYNQVHYVVLKHRKSLKA